MWPRRRNPLPLIEEERLRKMAASQQTLFDAVSATTSMAEDVTACLSGARVRPRDNGIDMLLVIDPRQRIVYANDALLNRYHLTHDVIGRDKSCILAALNPATLTDETPTRRTQLRVTGRDGRVRIEDWIEHAVFDGASLVEYRCTGRDITSSVVAFAKPRIVVE